MRDRAAPQIFERAADKIAHVDQRVLGQIVKKLHRALRCRAGRRGDVALPGGAGDIDAAVDRMDPRGAGIGHDDPGGAEYRQPADNAEPRVHRPQGEAFAAGDRDRHGDIGSHPSRKHRAIRLGNVGERAPDHRPRRRVDRRLADAERQAGPGHRADPRAGAKPHARSRLTPGQLGDDQRAMRHIRIVPGILDDAGAGEPVAQFGERQGKARRLAARQADRHRIGKPSGQQRGKGGARRRRGAGPGSPAAPQLRCLIPCHRRILEENSLGLNRVAYVAIPGRDLG